MSRIVLIALGLVMLAAPALAFNGSRRGFILGVGIGGGGTSFKADLPGDFITHPETQTRATFATDFELGGGVNEQLLVYYSNHVNWVGLSYPVTFDQTVWQSDSVLLIRSIQYREKETIASGVTSAGVSYFFSPSAPSAVVEGGIGFSGWSVVGSSHGSIGFGFWGGGGYEFSRHWLMRGKVTYGNLRLKPIGLSVSIHYLAY